MKSTQYDAEQRITDMTYGTSGQPIQPATKHGARIAYLTNNGRKVLLVQQTSFSSRKGQYVIDHRPDKSKVERHVNWDDEQGLAEAIRAAVEGRL